MISIKLRDGDVACRYGGEEFILILLGAPLKILERRATIIRDQLSTLKINYHGKTLKNITVSIGIATYPQHAKTPKALIKAADMALYQAKELGRDRAVVAKSIRKASNDSLNEDEIIAKINNVA